MCGIVGGVAQRDLVSILLECLKSLEYRGYDSAGIAMLNEQQVLKSARVVGKVNDLLSLANKNDLHGKIGVAHTRWATHGKPTLNNAHPHVQGEQVALVHNGIIENHEKLRMEQKKLGYTFDSDTDSAVIVNQIHDYLQKGEDMLGAVLKTLPMLEGSYTFSIISKDQPERLIAARSNSPLVIGIGVNEHFIASDIVTLSAVAQQFVLLEEGDIADITSDSFTIYDQAMVKVNRPIKSFELNPITLSKLNFRHYMLKEIHEQPTVVVDTLEGRLDKGLLAEGIFGDTIDELFGRVQSIQIVACGTSYHAGLIAKQWLEEIASIPCQVDVASEFRYRHIHVPKDSLFVTISQSGETADTLAALEKAKQSNFLTTLSICNVAESSLTRASDAVFLTRAGIEVGVASTKAFTAQLVALLLFTVSIAKRRGLSTETERTIVAQLENLSTEMNKVLELDAQISDLANDFAHKEHAIYLGRGAMLPVAMEGALKLKEVSYIHAEAYPAGELKHGPLALIDDAMPVIAIAPNDHLIIKLKSNLQEVRARGGKLYIITDTSTEITAEDDIKFLKIAPAKKYVAPIAYTLPLQLFAYHVAVLKGADVDQPRNLAKSVTVE